MLFKEIISAYYEELKRNTEINYIIHPTRTVINVKVGGTYNYHSALRR
jgi:hypothetical protein